MKLLGREARILIVGATSMIERSWEETERLLSDGDADRVYLGLIEGRTAEATVGGEPVTIRLVEVDPADDRYEDAKFDREADFHDRDES